MKKMYKIQKKLGISLILIILFSGNLNAQWETNGPYGGYITAMGTTENNTMFLRSASGEVVRSADEGQNWEVLNTGLENLNRYELVTIGPYILVNSDTHKISRSDDNGETWISSSSGFNSSYAPFLMRKCGSHVFATSTNETLYVSADSGRVWTDAFAGQTDFFVMSMATTDNTVFLGSTTNTRGVFRSADYGATWTELTNGLEVPGFPGAYYGVHRLAARNDTVFADIGGRMRCSFDNGDTWQDASVGYVATTYSRSMVFKDNFVYAAAGEELYRFNFDTNEWSVVYSGLVIHNLYVKDTTLFAGSSIGVFKVIESPTAVTMQELNNNLVCYSATTTAKVNDVVFTGSNLGGIYNTVDEGGTWSNLNNSDFPSSLFVGLIETSAGGIFVASPSASYNTRFYSSDLGQNWTAISPSPASYITGTEKIGDTIFVATEGAGIFRSVDGGSSFTTINSGLPNLNIKGLHSNGTTLFASVYTGGVYRSTDNGNTWIYSGLQGVVSFDFQFTSVGGTSFLGYYGNIAGDGVYRTTDDGVSWQKVIDSTTGFNLSVQKLYAAGNKVFAATISNGVYQLFLSDDSGNSWTDISQNLIGSDPYKSAANDSLIFMPAGNDVFVSVDNGSNWINITDNLSGDINVKNTIITSSKLFLTTKNRSVWQRNLSDFKAPDQPDPIIGTEYPCIGSVETYSVPELPLVNYNWQVPPGWGIASGQGTNTITVEVGSGTGLVLVVPSNNFGTGNSQYLSVMPVSSIPDQPNEIFGNAAPKINSTQTYSVDAITGAMYQWEFPSGWVQTSGGNSNQVTVTVGNSSGVITCTPFNGCGVGTAQTLAVTSSVGVNEINEHNILLYPNPVSNILKIKYLSEFKDKINVSITDITGKEVYKNEMISNLLYVNVNNFSKGVYFVHFNNSKLTATQKIVIN